MQALEHEHMRRYEQIEVIEEATSDLNDRKARLYFDGADMLPEPCQCSNSLLPPDLLG